MPTLAGRWRKQATRVALLLAFSPEVLLGYRQYEVLEQVERIMETPAIGRGTTTDLGFRAIVVTQFLTTFNDNAFRRSVLLLAVRVYRDENARGLASLSMILFVLPYGLLSLLDGV